MGWSQWSNICYSLQTFLAYCTGSFRTQVVPRPDSHLYIPNLRQVQVIVLLSSVEAIPIKDIELLEKVQQRAIKYIYLTSILNFTINAHTQNCRCLILHQIHQASIRQIWHSSFTTGTTRSAGSKLYPTTAHINPISYELLFLPFTDFAMLCQ